MKISKLLILGMLVVALGIVSYASAQECTAILADGLGPTGGTYQLGDTIEYIISVSVPASPSPPADPFCTLTDVSIYFFPPGSPPSDDACDDPASEGILIASGLTLLPGAAPFVYTSADNAALSYLITEANCDEGNLDIVADMATTFYIEGAGDLQCDENQSINEVEPVEAPPCGILGPELICEGDDDVPYESEFTADTYAWSVSGDAVIDGPADGPTVLVDPTGPFGYTVELEVCNDNGAEGCCSECDLEVDVVEAPECEILGPESVCEDAVEVEYCSGGLADLFFWTVSGDGVIVGPDDEPCVLVSPTGTGSYTVELAVCFEDPLCCDDCELVVDVIEIPDCSIEGPESVCEDDTGIEYCSSDTADSYSWDIIGDGVIVGPTDGKCVTVDAGTEGSYGRALRHILQLYAGLLGQCRRHGM
jgi:hypothetical protein